MIYTEEQALEKAESLSVEIRDGEMTGTMRLDHRMARVAASALLEAQADALEKCAVHADDMWMWDNATRLRAMAEKMRGE